jgi:hypothetical protein
MAFRLAATARYILPRLVVSLVLVFGASYLVIYLQGAKDRVIAGHAREVQNMDQDLQNARERIKSLQSPGSITPAKPGAKAYSNKLAEAKGAFDAEAIKIPQSLGNQTKDRRTAAFNRIISNPAYRQAIAKSAQILKTDKAFLTHQADVMKALANLLQYDPVKDLSSSDANTLSQHLSAAQGGLQITIDRLKAVPQYERDKTLNDLPKLVSQVQAARDKVAATVGSDDFAKDKQTFIDTVHQVQGQIIANRDKFWQDESQKLFKLTDNTQKTLHFYLVRLHDL